MSFLLPIISFDLVNTSNLNKKIFEIDNKEPMSESFRIFGYETKYVVPNLGSMFYLILLSPILILFLVVLNKLCR